MINTFLSASAFFLLPTLLGRAVAVVRNKLNDTPEGVAGYFFGGSLIFYALTLAGLNLVGRVGLYLDGEVVRLAGVMLAMVISGVNLAVIGPLLKLVRKNLGALIFCGLLTAGVSFIWKLGMPYPLTLNWDVFEHQTLVTQIWGGSLSFVTSRMSDTFQFNGYSTIFHTLIAWAQSVFGADAMGFWWMSELVMLFITTMISYALVRTVTNNNRIAMLGAVIGAGVFESLVVYSSLFLLPQTISAGAGIGLFTLVIKEEQVNWRLLISGGLFVILSHYIVGTAAVTVILLVITLRRWRVVEKPILYAAVTLAVPVIIYLILNNLGRVVNLSQINAGEAGLYTYDLARKMEMAEDFYGFSLYVLFPLGVVATILSRDKLQKLLLPVAFIMMAVILSTLPYAVKFYAIGRYFVHLYMAVGLGVILTRVNKWIGAVLILVVIAMFGLVMSFNLHYFKDYQRYQGAATQVAEAEMVAAKFLRMNYGKKQVFLVSDPATQYVLESLSGVNTQGGAYMKLTTRKLITQLDEMNAEEVRNRVLQVRDEIETNKPEVILLVVSGRFFNWQKLPDEKRLNIAYNAWLPADLTLNDRKFIYKLKDSELFREVYKNSLLVIFEVKTYD